RFWKPWIAERGFPDRLRFPSSLLLRTALVPIGSLLIAMSHAQQATFIKIVADDLQAYRTALVLALPKAARYGHGGQACQVGAQCIDIGQVHRNWVVYLAAQIARHGGRYRPHDDVALGKGTLVVLCHQTAYALRLQVVSVVIPLRQHVGARKNAALYFGAEPLGTRARCHIGNVVVFCRTMPVANAVKV